ncbi:MAG: hypothetical protein DSY80_08820 [Desulfocapsa sp.]|nr:MAG: hypothetical protein DSY80_08820 [Desulfocapsa sp.]
MPIIVYFEEYDSANMQAQMLRGRGTNVHIRRASLFSPEDREHADSVVIMPEVPAEITQKIVSKFSNRKIPIPCYQPQKGEILQTDPANGEIKAETVKITVKSIQGDGGIPISNEGQQAGGSDDEGSELFAETATPDQLRDALKSKGLAVPPRISDENLRNMYRQSMASIGDE